MAVWHCRVQEALPLQQCGTCLREKRKKICGGERVMESLLEMSYLEMSCLNLIVGL